MARSVVTGAVIGIVVLFVFGGIAGLVAGIPSVDAMGLGIFAAVWGGLGFGAMMGGATYMMRQEKHENAGH